VLDEADQALMRMFEVLERKFESFVRRHCPD